MGQEKIRSVNRNPHIPAIFTAHGCAKQDSRLADQRGADLSFFDVADQLNVTKSRRQDKAQAPMLYFFVAAHARKHLFMIEIGYGHWQVKGGE